MVLRDEFGRKKGHIIELGDSSPTRAWLVAGACDSTRAEAGTGGKDGGGQRGLGWLQEGCFLGGCFLGCLV